MRYCMLLLLAMNLLISVSSAHAATITFFTNNGYLSAVKELIPVFEARTGHKVDIQRGIATVIFTRVLNGEDFDLLVGTPPERFKEFADKGLVVPGSIRDLAKGSIGMGVKAGTPHPKIQTVEQFINALLQARKIAFTDPATGGRSGTHFSELLKRFNIEEQLNKKGSLDPTNPAVPDISNKLLRGEVDVAVLQIAELMAPGIEIVGPLPEEIQLYTVMTAAIGAKAKNPGPAQELMDFFDSNETHQFIIGRGLTPIINKK